LKAAYDIWCQQTGVVALGIRHLSRCAEDLGFHYKTIRVDNKPKKFGLYNETKYADLSPVDSVGLGLYRMSESDSEIILPENTTDTTYDKLMTLL
jgi:hypothetical protein